MKKKFISLCAFLLVIGMILSGCGNSGTSSSGNSNTKGTNGTASGKKQTLVVWTFFSQVQLLAKQFEKEHPNVDVQVKVFPGDQYKTKLQTALQTKTDVPDVFDLERGYIGQFADTPYVADLSAMGADSLVKNMVPYVAALGKNSQGKVIGIADSSSPIGLWYHRQAAKKWLGTDDPQKITSMMSSWDKIIQLGEKVEKESNGKVHLLDSTGSVFDMEKYQMKPWVDSNQNFTIDPNWNNVLNTMRTIRQNNVDAKLGNSSPGWGSALNNYSVNSPAIMFGVPSWATFYVDSSKGKADNQFGVASAPVGSYDGGTYRAIYANSPNKQLAYEFIKFDASKQWQNYNLKNTGNMPSLESVYDENASTYQPKMYGNEDVLSMYKKISNQIPAAPAGKYTADINSLFGAIVTDMITNGKSNQWAFNQLKQKVKETYPELTVK